MIRRPPTPPLFPSPPLSRPSPPPTQQVGRPAPEQQQPAVAENIPRHDPLQLGGREAQILLDRRKRHPDHRDVEPVEEQDPAERSEEHTSELQSQSNLVCRLL